MAILLLQCNINIALHNYVNGSCRNDSFANGVSLATPRMRRPDRRPSA